MERNQDEPLRRAIAELATYPPARIVLREPLAPDTVAHVRDRADIVDIIGQLVPLRKSGHSYAGLCPFVDEGGRSNLLVLPRMRFYQCTGCGASGSVFDFVMQRLGIDHDAAVRYVAAKSGVDL